MCRRPLSAEFRYAVPRRLESAPIAGRPAGTLRRATVGNACLGYFSPYSLPTGARERGCLTCDFFRVQWSGGHVVCEWLADRRQRWRLREGSRLRGTVSHPNGLASLRVKRPAQVQNLPMLLAITCLWIGFSAGLVCAALVGESSRDTRPHRNTSLKLDYVI